MSSAERFDRYVESLLGELAVQGIPAYLDEAVATATARPQRRPSTLSRLVGGSLVSGPSVLRTAMLGLPVVLALTIGLVGVLVLGGPGETPSPSPVPSLGTATPATPGPTASAPSPTASAVEPCPGYADAADARTLDDGGGDAWQGETGPPPPIESRREGFIAAQALELPGGRPAVVLIDPATGVTCRLIDLNANEEVHEFHWTSRGDALAISTGRRALVWSTAGLTELHRVPRGDATALTLAWSPTGEAVAIGGLGSRELRIVEDDWSWTELPIESVLELAWSPDGSRLYVAFPAHVGANVLDALITNRGQIDPIVIEAGVAGWLDIDTLIVGGTGATDGYDAYDVASGTRQPWSEASTENLGLINSIGYAPGLTAVALFANSNTDPQATPQDLIVQHLPSGEMQVLGTRLFPPFNAVGGGAWSPDRTRIAVSLEGAADDPRLVPGLWIYPLDGSEPIHLVSAFQVRVSNGAWQPLLP
jgi:hypothetical protein